MPLQSWRRFCYLGQNSRFRRFFRRFICPLLVLGSFTASADLLPPGHWQWAKAIGGSNLTSYQALAADASGDAVAAGFFDGQATVGTNTFTGPPGSPLLVKYSAVGDVAWARQTVPGEGNVNPGAISVSIGPSNSVYHCTQISSAIRGAAVIAAKYNADGSPAYAIHLSSSSLPANGVSYVNLIGAQASIDGSFFVACSFYGTAQFGNGLALSSTNGNLFVAKLGSDGTVLWARAAANTAPPFSGGASATAFCLDGTNGYWLAGPLTSQLIIGTNVLNRQIDSPTYLAHYDVTGQPTEAAPIGGIPTFINSVISIDAVLRIASNGNGKAILACNGTEVTYYNGNPVFWLPRPAIILTVPEDPFFSWPQQSFGPGPYAITDLAVDGQTHVHLSGNFTDHVDLQYGVRLSSQGHQAVFVTSYTSDGALLAARQASTPELTETRTNRIQGAVATCLAVDAGGDLLVGGYFQNTSDFDDINLRADASSIGSHAFIAKINRSPVITLDPSSTSELIDHRVVFSGQGAGIPPLSYQWLKNGTPILGQTNQSLVLAPVTVTDAGDYSIRVGDFWGTAVSSPAHLNISLEGAEIDLLAGATLTGTVGSIYSVQESPDGINNWSTITNVTLTASPQLWLNPSPGSSPIQYLRAIPAR